MDWFLYDNGLRHERVKYRVSNLKVEKQKFNYGVSNLKWNFVFFNFELVTRSATFYFSTSS